MPDARVDSVDGSQRPTGVVPAEALGQLVTLEDDIRNSLCLAHEKLDQLVALRGQVERNTQAIRRQGRACGLMAAALASAVSQARWWLSRDREGQGHA